MTSYKYQKQHASNYNYKPKRSFGQKIKNFFTIPEEDLKEEPSKEFEKIKLFTLNRGWLFLSILLFMIIINVLVAFNINFLYLRQILGFLFLILIPGLLIMLCFKIRTVKFWEYLVYTVGLSIAFIMFAGLLVNWTLPALNITDKPLSLWPILICFDIFLLGLWITAIYRNKDLKPFDITIPKLDTINRIFFIIPMIFPLLSILGAFLLNNHGPNILTMIMLGGIAVYVLLLVIFRKRMNENVWPWAILMISLALLLSFSMRSWFISGWDINQEMYVFRLTSENGIWSLSNYNDAYNTCLSLSILPKIISLFIKVNSQLIFKLFLQILFIFHSLTLFLIFKRYINGNLAFIASFFYFSGGYYNSVFSTLIRQEIAFLFFGLMILIIFAKDINEEIRKIFFVIFGVSMIVSHYSTAYIALALFTLTYLFVLIYKIYERKKIKSGKISEREKSEFYLTGVLVLLLILFSFLWLSQMTNTSEGVIYTFKNTLKNFGNFFSEDLRHSSIQASLFGQSKANIQTSKELNQYINNSISDDIKLYSREETHLSPLNIANSNIIYPDNRNLAYSLFYLYQFIKYLIIISFIFGSIIIYINIKKIVNREFSFMLIISVMLVFLIISLPFISKTYNFERLFQQCLTLLAFSSLIFFKKITRIFKNFSIYIIVLLYIFYFIFNLGILLSLSGGNPTLNLYNNGNNYDAFYTHNQEKYSIIWMDNNLSNLIYLDTYSKLKMYNFGIPTLKYDKKIIPLLMQRDSYVYSSYTNKIKSLNYWDVRYLNKGVFTFNFPKQFLYENKNIIYNNGGSEIFR